MGESFLSISLQKASHPSEDVVLFVTEQPDAWVIRSADSALYARLTKRQAYPITYCRQVSPTTVCLGYGSEVQDEFATITLHGNAAVSINRDNFATLPLFYYSIDTFSLVVSNEYATVIESIEYPTIRTSAIVDHLMVVDRPAPPPIMGVEVLREREQLTFRAGHGVAVDIPPDRDWRYNIDLPATDPKTFMHTFSEYLDYFIDSRLSGQHVAFGASGGLDSATLPQYFYQTKREPVQLVSMLFGTPYDTSQSLKLKALSKFTAATSKAHLLTYTTMTPLSSMTEPRYGEATFIEAFQPLLRQLCEEGVTVFATGDGGDEFFHNVTDDSFGMLHGEAAYYQRCHASLPEFFTPAFRQAYLAGTPKDPVLPLPHRPVNTGYSQLLNNIFIREGIWPVSPFSSPELYRYIQGIPAHFRANKNILRAFHAAKGFVKEVYDTNENEYFDVFSEQCMARGAYDALFEQVLPEARTVKMGYVDAEKIKEVYQAAKKHPKEGDIVFRLYCFLLLENSLRLSRAVLV